MRAESPRATSLGEVIVEAFERARLLTEDPATRARLAASRVSRLLVRSGHQDLAWRLACGEGHRRERPRA